MRLIDTENFSKVMKDYFTDMITHHKYNVDCVDCNADLQHLLDEQPTTYDVDKVVEKLETTKETACELLKIPKFLKKDLQELVNMCFDEAIEIVKQGGVSDDVCEWKMDNVGASIGCRSDLHHTGYVNRAYCPYCGKRIKVVE